MKYISIFSGIEAATVAWQPFRWKPIAFSEIDPFPSAVLQHHYPNIPNLGDITKIDWSPYVGAADIVVGGSPCQSFSIAGKREGLAGASGLMYEYIRAVRELRPRWFVWENVPGALTSEQGGAYRQLLSEMDALGYGLAWRVLDAQFFGVAQRRERVFLVGSLGSQRCAEVLFERESMSWDHQSSREKRQELAEETRNRTTGADRNVGTGCLTAGENHARRVYDSEGCFPTLSTRDRSGQNQQSVLLPDSARGFNDKASPASGSISYADYSPTLKASYCPSVFDPWDGQETIDDDESVDGRSDKAYLSLLGSNRQQRETRQTRRCDEHVGSDKQDDVMNALDRTNSTAVTALDFNPTDARPRYAHDDISQTLTARAGTGGNQVPLVQVQPVAFLYNQGSKARSLGLGEISPTLKTDHNPVVAFAQNQGDVAGAYICRADDQTNAMTSVNLAPTLTSHAKKDPPLIYPAEDSTREDEPVTLQIRGGKPGGGKGALTQRDMSATLSTHNTQTLITGDHEKRDLTVRRLTPRECERLQGFPDDYTDIPYRNKEHAPDGARYKALGNSMAVPVMRWIGERIQMVEEANKQTD